MCVTLSSDKNYGTKQNMQRERINWECFGQKKAEFFNFKKSGHIRPH